MDSSFLRCIKDTAKQLLWTLHFDIFRHRVYTYIQSAESSVASFEEKEVTAGILSCSQGN